MDRNTTSAPAPASSTVHLLIRAQACLLAVAILASGAIARQSPKQRSKSKQPALADNPLEVRSSQSLRSETRLVQISVIVDDRHGKPITGLTRHDFTVIDNGTKEPIQVFLVHESEPRGNRPTELPPDTYSNRLSDHTIPMSATVILLDGLNTKISDQQYARRQVIKFLNQIQPQDRVALYTLGDQLKLLHDFTNDAQSLLLALHRYQGHVSGDMQKTQTRHQTPDMDAPGVNSVHSPARSSSRSAQDDMLAGMFDQLEEAERGLQARDRAVRTVQALKEIANHMALLPGRKNLVWVAGSFLTAGSLQDVEMNTPNGGLLFTSDLEGVARSLNNASLVLYPVDARGLLVGRGFPDYGLPNYGEFAVMDEIAQRTGGKAFYNTNDIFGAVRKAVDDSRVSYEVGYYPKIEKWDGSFHKVRIKVDRHGAHVRTREGYFAVAGPAIPAKDLFGAAARNMLEADGIGITVHVSPPAAQAETRRMLSMSVTLEPGSLNLEEASEHWTGSFDTMLVQLDAKGVVLAASDDPVQLHITADQYRQIAQYGLSYREKADIRPSAAQLRVVVRDLEGGKTGSAAVPLARYFPASKPGS
jgi:VWFA-related protein